MRFEKQGTGLKRCKRIISNRFNTYTQNFLCNKSLCASLSCHHKPFPETILLMIKNESTQNNLKLLLKYLLYLLTKEVLPFTSLLWKIANSLFARLPSRIVSNIKFVNMWGHCGSQARTMSVDPHKNDTSRAKIGPLLWTRLSVVYVRMCMFTCVWTPKAATERLPQLLSTLCTQVFHLNTELADDLASHLAQGSYLCLQRLGLQVSHHTHLMFPQVLRIWIPGLTLYTATISPTSTLPIDNLSRS